MSLHPFDPCHIGLVFIPNLLLQNINLLLQTLVHMYELADLRCPKVMWENIIEPVGRIPDIWSFTVEGDQVTTALGRVIESKFQDSISRITSGAMAPNVGGDPLRQREHVSRIVDYLSAHEKWPSGNQGCLPCAVIQSSRARRVTSQRHITLGNGLNG